jgi:hypothetical protein
MIPNTFSSAASSWNNSFDVIRLRQTLRSRVLVSTTHLILMPTVPRSARLRITCWYYIGSTKFSNLPEQLSGPGNKIKPPRHKSRNGITLATQNSQTSRNSPLGTGSNPVSHRQHEVLKPPRHKSRITSATRSSQISQAQIPFHIGSTKFSNLPEQPSRDRLKSCFTSAARNSQISPNSPLGSGIFPSLWGTQQAI